MGDWSLKDEPRDDAQDWAHDALPDFDDLLQQPARWARLFRGTTVAGLLFGVVGPYGSFIANPTTRLFYWTMLFWAGTILLWPSTIWALRFGGRRGFPLWFAGAIAILIASIPLASVAAFGCHIFWPVHASGIRPLEWYVQTIVIALPAVAVALWYETGQPQLPQMVSELGFRGARAVPSPGKGAPLPLHLIEAALCLQMEDHHVRVHTVGRSYLHLAPLHSVTRDLGSERGVQVHRSWWVARSAIQDWEEDGRSVSLILTNGLRVPVARNRVAHLRALGWLDRR